MRPAQRSFTKRHTFGEQSIESINTQGTFDRVNLLILARGLGE